MAISRERRCGTCRHFESSLDSRQGWCRNPRLQAPGRSQPVAAIDLACAYRDGDYWEPVEGHATGYDATATTAEDPWNAPVDSWEAAPDRVNSPESPIEDETALYNEQEREFSEVGLERSQGNRNRRSLRRTRADSETMRQESFVSYQPEERYWTDYLRIALPIAGLLLLLGVFWYWASSFIGDDDNDPGQNTQVAVVETPITAPTQTPTVGTAVTIEAVNTIAPTQEAAPTQDSAAPTATTGTGENGGTDTGSGFAEGDNVVVNDNDVNLRSEPTIDSEIMAILMNGDELTIIGATPTDADDFTWWNVRATDGTEGWVAADFLQASGT